LDFKIVPKVWYFLFYILFRISLATHKARINKLSYSKNIAGTTLTINQ